ncbi:arsenate reductase [Marmoricola sp. OAE513]|uniref:ArsC/Spx/MgsR family protein n=1 Tax=Marmoricola sp. OAE513 TaxID=2817894 RepID=UPI001AE37993
MEIWINPACSKCRVATDELDAAGIEYTVRRYLDDPPSVAELREVLDRMGLDPWHVARTAETREAGIDLPRDAAHREDWIAAMVANPRTIQRPIVTATDGTTVVARDAETLKAIVERG